MAASVMLAATAPAAFAAEADGALAKRGKYVFATAGGCACHTPPDGIGLNAGGRKFEGPFGTVHSANITPDPDTGIGKWTDAQIVNAIRRGERPDGSKVFPIHPYAVFANIADDEARALAAFLKSVPPIRSQVPPPALKAPVPVIPVAVAPTTAPRNGVARGEYLVKGPAHCVDCHTPRGANGAPDPSRFLAGGSGPEGSLPANITPDKKTGVGSWTEAQMVKFLRTGIKPSGQRATSLMEVVIQGSAAGYKDLTESDARAIAKYLKTVPAVEHRVQ
jgi:mono/diheme cytochrome c family protein